ncbi:nucleotidyltransferase family protein [Patescibacteria group bacterium]|nr:nucleotidyltransferase family protein [Patescibacteria group bacterium]
MKPLRYKKNKGDILYVLALLRYFFKTGPRPQFKHNILKNQAFFSLIKNTSILGFAYQILKQYPEFKNTWLDDELHNYYQVYTKKDKKNLEIIEKLKKIAKNTGIKIVVLKEYNYKLNPSYKTGSRFCTDVDILVQKKDLLCMHKSLEKNNFGSRFVDFQLEFKPALYIDGNLNIFFLKTKGGVYLRKKEILKGIENTHYKDFAYLLGDDIKNVGLLELHFLPNSFNYNSPYPDIMTLWNNIEKISNCHLYKLKPEARVLYDANHFFIHLHSHKIYNNGHYEFHAHLKRICDLAYNLQQETIDWKSLINMVNKQNLSGQLYYYLFLGKKWLNLDIPTGILQKLKANSSKLELFFLNRMDDLLIFSDTRNFWTKMYTKILLVLNFKKSIYSNKRCEKKITIRSTKKEKNLLLDIVKTFFLQEKKHISLSNIKYKTLDRIIKETSMDGICYQTLKKNKNIPSWLVKSLKSRFKIIKSADNSLKLAFLQIKDIPVPKTLLKDSAYRFTEQYITGTRYACDINIYIPPESVYIFDNLLKYKDFYSEGAEIQRPDTLLRLAHKINKDISYYSLYQQEIRALIEKHKFLTEDCNPAKITKMFLQKQDLEKSLVFHELLKNEVIAYSDLMKIYLNSSINRIKKISTSLLSEKSIQYRYDNGAFLDIHHKLFLDNLPFDVNMKHFDINRLDTYLFTLNQEDSVIINACHFCFNLSKHADELNFQGFLKYLGDLHYSLKSKKFDWKKIINLSKKTNASPQTYFYLKLGKDYLDVPVPEEILQQLEKNGSRMQNFLFKRINGLKLLFNESTIIIKIYSKMYLEKGWIRLLTIYSHRIYNKLRL